MSYGPVTSITASFKDFGGKCKVKNANEEEIKKAYRKRAMVHHPDRHAGATEVEKKDHEQKFKEVMIHPLQISSS